MLNINDIKNGMTIIYEGNVYQVIEFQHVKPGKGAAFVRTKLKNLKANTTREVTFNSDIKIEKARVDKKQLSYLYNAGNNYVFMDNSTYEQMELDKNTLGDNIKFLKEGLNVEIIYEDHIFRKRLQLDKGFVNAVFNFDKKKIYSYFMEKLLLVRRDQRA